MPPAKIDTSRFRNMDTEQEAYWLGMLFTDGCLFEARNEVILALQHGDHSHVAEFARFLGSDRLPRINTTAGTLPSGRWHATKVARFQTCSKELADNLRAAGMHGAKTWTVRPWAGPRHLLRHFWRGALDGDGSITIAKLQNGADQSQVSFCGNEAMVTGFSQYIKEEIGSSGSIHSRMSQATGNMFFSVSWHGTYVAKEIAELLYNGASVALPRKTAAAALIAARQPTHVLRYVGREELLALFSSDGGGSWNAVARSLNVSNTSILAKVKKFRIQEHEVASGRKRQNYRELGRHARTFRKPTPPRPWWNTGRGQWYFLAGGKHRPLGLTDPNDAAGAMIAANVLAAQFRPSAQPTIPGTT